jgi:DNA polymerase I
VAATKKSRTDSTFTALDADQIFVDGHNLAIRCTRVKSLAKLQDKRGRPTGILHGFLNVLLSIKRFLPWAKVVVGWDGTSERRKALFAEYKANRSSFFSDLTPRPTTLNFDHGAIPWLKSILPLMDVEQAWNPNEECDDVLATLVRRASFLEPKKRSVILSTDRDFLQLVKETSVRVLAPPPKSVSGKAKLYGPAEILQEYGVSASRILLLRAI